MKIINRKEQLNTEQVELLDIFESEGGYFYQIHLADGANYVIICLNDESRGILGMKQGAKTISEIVKYLHTIADIKTIHRKSDTVLVLESK